MRAFAAQYLLVICVLMLSLCAPLAFAQDTSNSPKPQQETPLKPPTVEVKPPEGDWVLGHSHELSLIVRHSPAISAFFPEKPATPGFLLREVRDKREQSPQGEIKRTITLVLLPIRLDFLRLPTIDLAWRGGKNDEQRGTVPVDLGRVKVKGKFANPEQATPGSAPSGLTILQRNTALLVGMIAVALALAAMLLTLFIAGIARRFLSGRKAAKIPADITALEALKNLENNTELQGEPVRFFTRLSEVLRAYLGGRYAFEALEATSTELLRWAEEKQPAGLSSMSLGHLLEAMDTVKFAGRSTYDEEGLEKLSEVRQMVMATRESEKERSARVAQLRALVPEFPEKLMAFSIDLIIGGALSVGLHLAGAFSQNWILIASGAGVMGLWLLLRDSMGRSPGKAAQSLVIVPVSQGEDQPLQSQDAVGTGSRIARNLLLFVWVLLPAEAVASYVLPGGRRLGDLWARTRILREKEGGKDTQAPVAFAAGLAALAIVLIPPIWALMQLPGGIQ